MAPVGGLVAGAVVGIALALSGGSVWRAQTIVYLGQPFAPLGGGQIQSLATNPRTVSEIIRSEAVIQRASRVSGIPASQLRSSISTRELLAAGQLRGINPLFEISVKGSGKRKVELAADALAGRVTERVSLYVTEKVALLNRSSRGRRGAARGCRGADPRGAGAAGRARREPVARAGRAAPPEPEPERRDHDGRRSAVSLQEDLDEARQLLNLAENVESSRVVERAAASKTTARSSRSSLLVGALIGLILGAIAALVVDPIAARRRGTPRPRPDARRQTGRGRRARVRRGATRRRDDPRDPGVRRPDLRRGRRLARRDGRGCGGRRRPARRGPPPRTNRASAPPSPRAIGGARGGDRRHLRHGRRQPDGSPRARELSSRRSRGARSSTRRRTGSSPARPGR